MVSDNTLPRPTACLQNRTASSQWVIALVVIVANILAMIPMWWAHDLHTLNKVDHRYLDHQDGLPAQKLLQLSVLAVITVALLLMSIAMMWVIPWTPRLWIPVMVWGLVYAVLTAIRWT